MNGRGTDGVDAVRADCFALLSTIAALSFAHATCNLGVAIAVVVANNALALCLLKSELAIIKTVLLVEVTVGKALVIIIDNATIFAALEKASAFSVC